MNQTKQSIAILFSILALVFTACEKETLEPDTKTTSGTTTPQTGGRFDNKLFEWDYSFMPFLSPNETFVGTVTLPQNNSGFYVGAVYPFPAIESGLFDKDVVNIEKNPVRMLFKFPMDYRHQMSNTKDESEYSKVLELALNSDKYRDHVISLNEGNKEETGYNITEYASLSDVEKAFGANVKSGTVFASKIQQNSKAVNVKGRMLACVVGRNFKVSMVTPSSGFFANESDNQRDNLAYVRALSYGKLAFISIESSYSYEEVKEAFEAGIKYKFIGAGAGYDEKTKNVFADSRITIMVTEDSTKETFYINSTESLKDVFNTSYTKSAYGKPIFVELVKVIDGGAFIPSASAGNRGNLR